MPYKSISSVKNQPLMAHSQQDISLCATKLKIKGQKKTNTREENIDEVANRTLFIGIAGALSAPFSF